MRSRCPALLLLFGLVFSSTFSLPQVLSCVTVQGDWTWAYTGDQYLLSQDNSGNISGSLLSPFCPGNLFPLTGTINSSGEFTYTVTGLDGVCGSFVTWLTFTGNVGQL